MGGNATRWTTPGGVIIDVITRTGSGGPAARPLRDSHTDPGGDGQWIRVRTSRGILLGMVRDPGELAALGTRLGALPGSPFGFTLADLTEAAATASRRRRTAA